MLLTEILTKNKKGRDYSRPNKKCFLGNYQIIALLLQQLQKHSNNLDHIFLN